MTKKPTSEEVPMTWARVITEDASKEFRALGSALRHSRSARAWHRLVWDIDTRLLAWTENVDPSGDYLGKFLASDDDGNFLVPHGTRNGEPWWQGTWRWWRLDHWPVYLRSRRHRAYVIVEPGEWS